MAEHACEDCDREFRSASGLASHRQRQHPPQREGYVFGETVRAIQAASKQGTGHLEDADAGVVAVLKTLARTIDGIPDRDEGAPLDNVTVPTYLKYADALGLTPLSRLKLDKPDGQGTSKLGQLRAVRGDRAS